MIDRRPSAVIRLTGAGDVLETVRHWCMAPRWYWAAGCQGVLAQHRRPKSLYSVPAATDAGAPAAGDRFLYLATVRNRLGERGTPGFTSTGMERSTLTPCPW